MHLAFIDWAIIIGYLIIIVIIGIIFSRRGTQSVDQFFVANRSLPWWLAGMTMVASAFAIDTPLGIMGLVARNGIPGMWYAWSFVLGGAGALGAFIFASLLRRSEVITVAELIELRYSGRSAAMLRGFKGVYFGIFQNAITLGWIIKAVMTLTHDVFGFNPHITLAVVLAFTLFYTTLSGLWGIVMTDFIQFIIGFVGIVTLSIYAWNHVGGIDKIISGFVSRYGQAEAMERLSFFPSIDSPFFITFIVFITLRWWGNPTPAIHQRIVASKNEKHASLSTLIFSIMAFAINYWPMIMIAMVSLVVYPDLAQPERGFGMLMVQLLPAGLLGLVIASMLAAFMSTVDTHINYGASYMVNDIYRRFIKKDASEKHYVRASQLSTVIMLAIAVIIAYMLDSVQQAWFYMATLTAGYGFLVVLRWFWWKINAWSEITALIASGIISTLLAPKFANFVGYGKLLEGLGFGRRYLLVLSVSTLSWIIVTIFTKPSEERKLAEFCRKVKPYPFGWGPIYKKYKDIEWNPNAVRNILHWFFGIIGIFSICFGIGNLIFKNYFAGYLLLALALVIFFAIYMTWEWRKERKGAVIE